MSDLSSETLQRAAEAAERLIGFYPSITASDAKVYAAGMVQVLAHYPEHLVAEAIDPFSGLPSLHDYPPTMKQLKAFLEPRWQDERRRADLRERFNRKRLPEPPEDPERKRKMVEGFQKLSAQLKAGIGPSSV
jgi:hypothetical protein